eukprot:gene11595-22204_t
MIASATKQLVLSIVWLMSLSRPTCGMNQVTFVINNLLDADYFN